MSDESFKQQREGYMPKKGSISGYMAGQGGMFWAEIIMHQFCFQRTFFDRSALQSVERDDILSFYDYYISPRSTNRRKLALHVCPSPLGLQSQISEIDAVKNKDKLAIITGKRLPSITNIKYTHGKTTAKKQHGAKKLTEHPPIIDTLIKRSLKILGNALVEKDIHLPKTEWIENIHVWKSTLPCFSLCQPYEQIDVPVVYKL